MAYPPSISPDAAGRPRVEWIDTARGIALVLMVFEHVRLSLVAAGLAPDDAAYRLGDALIYSFHMPVFFVVSGLVTRRPVRGRRRAFVCSRLEALAYPYFLWSLVQGSVAILAARHVNHGVRWPDLAAILWEPIGQFWFLYVLFLCHLLLLVPGRYSLAVLALLGAWLSARFGGGTVLLRTADNLLYFALGLWLSVPRLDALLSGRRAWAVAAIAWAAFLPLFLLTHAGWWNERPVWSAPPQLLAVLGVAGTFGLARLVAPRSAWLAALGRASMPVYLLHVMAGAAARMLLHDTKLDQWSFALLLTLAGLILPYGAYRIARRCGLERLLGFGRSARGPAPLPPAMPEDLAATAPPTSLEVVSANADVKPLRGQRTDIS